MGIAAQGWVSAADYANAQLAVDAVPSAGGVVFFPGSFDITSIAPLVLRRNIRLVGTSRTGLFETGGGTGPPTGPAQLVCTNANKNIIEVIDAPMCTIENLRITGADSAGTQIGIKAGVSSQTISSSLIMKQVYIEKCGSHGAQIRNMYLSSFYDLYCVNNKGRGFYAEPHAAGFNPHWKFVNTWFMSNDGIGFYAEDLGNCSFDVVSFQDNGGASQAYFEDCTMVEMRQFQFELIESGSNNLGIEGYRLSNFLLDGGKFICNADPGTAAKAALFHDIHDSKFDNIFMDRLNSGSSADGNGLHFTTDTNKSRRCSIGRIYTPNGNITPIVGTEGSDFEDFSVSVIQSYSDLGTTANSGGLMGGLTRSLDANSIDFAYKIKGQIVRIRTAVVGQSPLYVWSGSAWEPLNKVPTATVATLPAAAAGNAGHIVYVSDGSAGQKFRGSDGSAWLNLG